MNLFVVSLNLKGQLHKKVGSCIESGGTSFLRTHHLFKMFDLINGIMVKARLAKVLLVLAWTDVYLLIFVVAWID